MNSQTKLMVWALSVALVLLNGCAHFTAPPTDSDTEIQEIIARSNDGFYLDERIWYQDIQGELDGNRLILTGEAFYSRPIKGLERRLKRAGYELELIDQVTYLPESFPDGKGYALVIAPSVMGRYKPVDVKQEGTEMLFGEPVRLIRELEKYYQVQSSTGYLGYVPKHSLRPVTLAEWNRYHVGAQAIFPKNVTLDDGTTFALGTRLPYLGEDKLLLPSGEEQIIARDHYRIVDPILNPIRSEIIEDGKAFLGLPYVWGGRSSEGVDCSGFVMQTFSLSNIYLPRDTDEMANTGRIIGLPGWMDALLPGDLLFFTGSRRLVTHVAIYMGDGKVIHSLGKGVQIQSMNPDHDDFAPRLLETFIFAKRMFE